MAEGEHPPQTESETGQSCRLPCNRPVAHRESVTASVCACRCLRSGECDLVVSRAPGEGSSGRARGGRHGLAWSTWAAPTVANAPVVAPRLGLKGAVHGMAVDGRQGVVQPSTARIWAVGGNQRYCRWPGEVDPRVNHQGSAVDRQAWNAGDSRTGSLGANYTCTRDPERNGPPEGAGANGGARGRGRASASASASTSTSTSARRRSVSEAVSACWSRAGDYRLSSMARQRLFLLIGAARET